MKNDWQAIRDKRDVLKATKGKPHEERRAALGAVDQGASNRQIETQSQHYDRRAAKMSRKTFGGGWRAAKAAQRAEALRKETK